MPSLAVLNESTVLSDDNVKALIGPLTTQWNRDLSYVWGVKPVSMVFLPKNVTPQPGQWWLVFLDNSDQADALAYHDLTSEGRPLAKVFCADILNDGALVSVGASHELCEMAVDPMLNSASQDPNGRFWATEVCDPCEDDAYAYDIDGEMVSDFVTPNWFSPPTLVAGDQIDFQGHVSAPFEVLTGGYAQYFDPNAGWQQVIGQQAQQHQRKMVPLAGSRRERRARLHKDKALKHSAHILHR